MNGMTDEKETLDPSQMLPSSNATHFMPDDPSKMPPPNNAPHFTGDQTEQDKRLE